LAKKIEIDVLNHVLTPKVRVLSKKEKGEVIKFYNAKEEDFPKIYDNDPLVIALKAKVGDMLEIKRNDGTGEYLYYRIVIESP